MQIGKRVKFHMPIAGDEEGDHTHSLHLRQEDQTAMHSAGISQIIADSQRLW
jgi:hypothetical protein